MLSTERKKGKCTLLAKKFGMAGIPWSPVSMGFLTRPWESFISTTRGGNAQGLSFQGHPYTEIDKSINERIEEIAAKHGVSMAIVAIAWSLSKPFVTAPILGMSKKERVDEAIKAIEFKLSAEEVKSIDDLYVPKQVIGHL